MDASSTSTDQNLNLVKMRPLPTSPSRQRFSFSQYWFDEVICAVWDGLTHPLHGKKLRVLEIGSFEGASTTWILDNLMSHPESRLTSIDTFEGGMEHREADKADKYNVSSLESRFRANVAKCDHVGKLQVMKARSDDALLELRRQCAKFDFVYIDGSHVAIDVLHDAVMTWPILNVYGIMVFDDLTWKGYVKDVYNPRIAIRSFVSCVAQEVEAKRQESQMWVTRVPNHTPPTPNPDPARYYWEEDSSLNLGNLPISDTKVDYNCTAGTASQSTGVQGSHVVT